MNPKRRTQAALRPQIQKDISSESDSSESNESELLANLRIAIARLPRKRNAKADGKDASDSEPGAIIEHAEIYSDV
jgi:hypothetical protein